MVLTFCFVFRTSLELRLEPFPIFYTTKIEIKTMTDAKVRTLTSATTQIITFTNANAVFQPQKKVFHASLVFVIVRVPVEVSSFEYWSKCRSFQFFDPPWFFHPRGEVFKYCAVVLVIIWVLWKCHRLSVDQSVGVDKPPFRLCTLH